MESKFEEIIFDLKALKEDRPNLIITDDIIRDYIEQSMDDLIEEIKNEL